MAVMAIRSPAFDREAALVKWWVVPRSAYGGFVPGFVQGEVAVFCWRIVWASAQADIVAVALKARFQPLAGKDRNDGD
jgi:hypothetical protein